jgi:hypothetical protein
MSHAVSKHQASFREPFAFVNSPAAIARFPYPFDRDTYMYAVNIEPHVSGAKGSAYEHKLDVDEHYLARSWSAGLFSNAILIVTAPCRTCSFINGTHSSW